MRTYLDIRQAGVIHSHSFAISGRSATGKSTLFNQLRQHFESESKFAANSAGMFFRTCGARLGMTIEQFGEHCKTSDIDYDLLCDTQQETLGQRDHVILEGHYVELFTPMSFHILTYAPPKVRAERRQKEAGYNYLPIEQVAKLLEERDARDNERIMARYGTRGWATADFDAVINTEKTAKEDMLAAVLSEHAQWLKKNAHRQQLAQP